MAKKVLLVSTSAGQMGEHPTGLWISELAEPYTVFTKADVSRHRRDAPRSIECTKPDGTPLVAGLEVTCFSDVEEDQVGQTEAVKPFSGSNEQGLAGKGGKYSKGDPWTSHVVVSGNLVTGQNPQSAEAFAEAVVKALA